MVASPWPCSGSQFQSLEFSVLFIHRKELTSGPLSSQNKRRGKKKVDRQLGKKEVRERRKREGRKNREERKH